MVFVTERPFFSSHSKMLNKLNTKTSETIEQQIIELESNN